MSASNMGIVFGPTLLRPSEGAASLASLMDTAFQARVVELLIQNSQVSTRGSLAAQKVVAVFN